MNRTSRTIGKEHWLRPLMTIRGASRGEFEMLADIERRAATRFPEELGLDGDATCEASLLEASLEESLLLVAVASGRPAGFAVAVPVERSVHLEEMSVLPEAGRNGLGRALLASVVDASREREYRNLTLTTFASVPWNAPFYARHGFRAKPSAALPRHVAERLEAERAAGLPDRVGMEMRLMRDWLAG